MARGEWNKAVKGAWTGIDWSAWRSVAGVRADPYFVWADITNFGQLGGAPEHWLAVILELNVTAQAFWEITQPDRTWIRVPEVYHRPGRGLQNTRFCTAVVRKDFFLQLQGPFGQYVKRFELGLSIIAPTAPHPPADPPHYAVDSTAVEDVRAPAAAQPAGVGTVFVGIIDDGLPFANERFLERGGGTRVEYFWNQEERSTSRFLPPPLIPYGRELDKRFIDELIAQSIRGGGLRDEDWIYREADYAALSRRATHGAHVMDIACGLEPAHADPARAPRILAVHLPTSLTSDTSSRSLSAHALDAMRYVLDRADYLSGGKPAKVVINLSYGNIAGAHDGSTILEMAMDELVDARGSDLAIVLPAGNSFQSRCHARLRLGTSEADSRHTLRWRVLPDDQTPSFLEVWLLDGAHGASVSVTPPGGPPSGAINQGEIGVLMDGGNALCTVVYLQTPGTGNNDVILFALAPTHSVDPQGPLASAGTWQIEVANKSGKPLEIASWIQRDDTPYGFAVRGRQSRFDDPDYVRFNPDGTECQVDNSRSYVRRAGTISGIATGARTIVLAGFERRPIDAPGNVMDGVTTSYSSEGPGVGPSPRRPDALAISEDSPGMHGVLGSGTRTGSVVPMNGTSVAAPRITRWLVERFAAGQAADQAAAQSEARRQEAARQRVPPYTAPPPPDRGGDGRIDLPAVHDRRFDWG